MQYFYFWVIYFYWNYFHKNEFLTVVLFKVISTDSYMHRVGDLIFGDYSVQKTRRAYYYVAIPKVVAQSLSINKGTRVRWVVLEGISHYKS